MRLLPVLAGGGGGPRARPPPPPPPPPPAAHADLRPGDGIASVTWPAARLQVFTYRPASCRPRFILLVFHGVARDADRYRDDARPIADAACALVVAPRFDRQAFPRSRYQYGGVEQGGVPTPLGRRTVDLIEPLVAWARAVAGDATMPYVLLGHSAGAQFVDRVAAYAPPAAACIVVANPSTWVLPLSTAPAPFGFGNIEASPRTYLSLPIVVLLGAADTGSHDLATGPEAMAEGPDRLTRGLRTFELARATAREHGWPFGWTLLEVAGVGHDAKAMFASPQALRAVDCPRAAARQQGSPQALKPP